MGREGGGGGGGGWWCAGGVLVVCWWCAGGVGLKNLVSIISFCIVLYSIMLYRSSISSD